LATNLWIRPHLYKFGTPPIRYSSVPYAVTENTFRQETIPSHLALSIVQSQSYLSNARIYLVIDWCQI